MDCKAGLDIREMDCAYRQFSTDVDQEYRQTSGNLSSPKDQPIAHLRVWPCTNSVMA